MHQYHSIRQKWQDDLSSRSIKNFPILDNLIPWNEYIKELEEYKFCLSPPGRGIDCYRTWEALKVGSIPIVLKTCKIMNNMYNDLPVVLIEDSKELTNEFLETKYKEIISNFDNYNWSKLNISYWSELILKEKSCLKIISQIQNDSYGLYMNLSNSRLGNVLFKYAFLMMLGIEKKMPIFLESVCPEFQIFKNINYTVKTSVDTILVQESKFRYEPEIMNQIKEQKNYLFSGYFQSPKYFEKYETEIKKCFEFKDEYVLKTNDYYKAYTQDGKKLCGIHIRLCDIRHESNWLYSLPSSNFVSKAIDRMRKHEPNIRFLICSNDMEYCKILFSKLFPEDTVYFEKNHFEDFIMLSRCDHNIITPGSFGWWTAYLNSNPAKLVIGFHPIFSSVGEYKGTNETDYYPKEWIVMEN